MSKKSGTSYTSKGQRPNVARKTINMMRQERRAHPPVEDVLKQRKHKQGIISKPRGKKEQELRDRYIEEERVAVQAWKLMEHYRDVGLPKSAAVQAVKTNFSEQLHAKWGPILKKFRDSEKTGGKGQIIKPSTD